MFERRKFLQAAAVLTGTFGQATAKASADNDPMDLEDAFMTMWKDGVLTRAKVHFDFSFWLEPWMQFNLCEITLSENATMYWCSDTEESDDGLWPPFGVPKRPVFVRCEIHRPHSTWPLMRIVGTGYDHPFEHCLFSGAAVMSNTKYGILKEIR